MQDLSRRASGPSMGAAAPSTRRDMLLAAVAAGLSGPASAAAATTWPTGDDWPTTPPSQAGFDAAKLDAAVAAMLADHSAAVLVLRGGRIVVERYAQAGEPPVREIASAGKSMLSVLIGMAIDDGHIKGVEQSASAFVPQWRDGPKAAITMRHLLTMTSGLDFSGLKVRNVRGDQFALNAAAPLIAPPGTKWAYSTPVYHLLFHVIARATGERFETYAQRKLLGPLGMRRTSWVTNDGQGSAGPVTNYYTARSDGRDLARFGLFALNGGVWRGTRLVNADYMRAATSPSQALNPSYGYLWWENREPGVPPSGEGPPSLRYAGAPRDLFTALGAGGQLVAEVPSLDLVMVRQGEGVGGDGGIKAFVRDVCAAAAPARAAAA